MSMVRELLILQTAVPYPEQFHPKSAKHLDLPDEFEAGSLFVREVITPVEGSGRAEENQICWIDDDEMPAVCWPKGSEMYEAVRAHLEPAKPSVAKIMHEYDAYMPHSLWAVLRRLVEDEFLSLDALEQAVIAYRRSMDFDMQDEDDTIILPGDKPDDKPVGKTILQLPKTKGRKAKKTKKA